MDIERFKYKRRLRFGWLLKMAWRDSRRNRSRLFLFVSSIVLGIAALVAIFSLGDNVRSDIDSQAKTLVGADLVIESNKKISSRIRPLLDSLGDQRSVERTFGSMIYLPKTMAPAWYRYAPSKAIIHIMVLLKPRLHAQPGPFEKKDRRW